MARRAIVLSCALVLTAHLSLAQSSPLPERLEARFVTDAVCLFRVPAGAQNQVRVVGRYDNVSEARTVSFDWIIQHGTAQPKLHEMTIPVSFRPLAVTPRAGTSNVVYVAGWLERSGGQLVLERWTLQVPATIGATLHLVTGVEETVSTTPTVIRDEPMQVDAAWPIWALCCNPFGASDKLLLLRDHDPLDVALKAELWEFDLASESFVDHDHDGQADPLLTSIQLPALERSRDLFSSEVQGVGFVMMAGTAPRWTESSGQSQWVVFWDADKDGAFSPGFPVEPDIFLGTYPYSMFDAEYAP